MLRAERGDLGTGLGEAGGGHRFALRPCSCRRRPCTRQGQRRQGALRKTLGTADGVEPDLGVAAGGAQLAGLVQLLDGRRGEVGQLDQDRVGEDPTRRGVAALGDAVAGQPQLLDYREATAFADPVHT